MDDHKDRERRDLYWAEQTLTGLLGQLGNAECKRLYGDDATVDNPRVEAQLRDLAYAAPDWQLRAAAEVAGYRTSRTADTADWWHVKWDRTRKLCLDIIASRDRPPSLVGVDVPLPFDVPTLADIAAAEMTKP